MEIEKIKDLGRKIADEFHPEKIILFGSHAAGTQSEGSDIDLIVRSPKQMKERIKWNDFF